MFLKHAYIKQMRFLLLLGCALPVVVDAFCVQSLCRSRGPAYECHAVDDTPEWICRRSAAMEAAAKAKEEEKKEGKTKKAAEEPDRNKPPATTSALEPAATKPITPEAPLSIPAPLVILSPIVIPLLLAPQ